MIEIDLTIILLTHNRINFAIQAIKSILNQTNKDFRFIISDNSTTFELRDYVKNNFSEVEYITWYPGISAASHFTEARKLVESKYFVLFHDDDLMDPTYVENILYQFKISPAAAAIGTNGYIINNDGTKINENFLYDSENKIDHFDKASDFIMRYLTVEAGRAAGFSTYAYNKNLIYEIKMDWSRGRAYFDTIFLAEIVNKKNILWINKPLVMVRDHENRISSNCGVRDYKAFVNIVRNEYYTTISEKYIEEYRLVNLFNELKKRKKFHNAAIKYFFIYVPKLIVISSNFRKRFYRYLFIKNK